MARTDYVSDWLKALGALSAANMSAADARAKIVAYRPMLAAEYPDWCFTQASLAAVAKGFTFFPAYGELAQALTAWRKDNAPAGAYDKPRIAGPAPRTEADEGRADRDWWNERIDRIANMPNAQAAHREACGMLEVLTRPPGTVHAKDLGAFPRPWALERLRRIRDTTREAMEETA
jgi:hypothetical protein